MGTAPDTPLAQCPDTPLATVVPVCPAGTQGRARRFKTLDTEGHMTDEKPQLITGTSKVDPVFLSFAAAGGVQLSCARLDVGQGAGRVMVFLHGIGSYGALYYHMAEGLCGAVDHVYFPDLRGHGRSGGKRGDLGRPRQVLDDIDVILAGVRAEHPGAAVVLAGESMGGLLALAYASEHPDTIDGLVLAAPALKLSSKGIGTRDSIRRGWEGLFSTTKSGPAGSIPVTGGFPNEVPRDRRFVELTMSDPLVLQSVSLKYLATLGSFIFLWPARYAQALADATRGKPQRTAGNDRRMAESLAHRGGGPLPVLILQGGQDQVMDSAAPRRFAAMVPSAEYVEFPDAWHNLFSDPDSPRVLATISEWVSALPAAARQQTGGAER
jgi:lysophospholipase